MNKNKKTKCGLSAAGISGSKFRQLMCGIVLTSFAMGIAAPVSASTIMFRPPVSANGILVPTTPSSPAIPSPPLEDIELTVSGVVAKAGAQFSTPAPIYSKAGTDVRFFTNDDLSGTDLSVDPATGIISGTLSFAQSRSINLSVTDSSGRLTTETVDIEIVPHMRVAMAESTSLAVHTAMQPIVVTRLDAFGSTSWDPIPGNSLPPGVSFDALTGTFSGTPTVAGTYGPITITARDSLNDVASTTVTIVVEVAAAVEMAFLDVGDMHSCSLSAEGGVNCWGHNGYGQLGPGPESWVPVSFPDFVSGVKAISVGSFNNCVITPVGGVKCWGSNRDGQLGDNSTSSRNTPVDVFGLQSGVVAIAGGDGNVDSGHTCAITVAGGVKCWGNNSDGQLGNNTRNRSLVPVDVVGLQAGVSAITTGSRHTCALMDTGGVKCWGYNSAGQLGDGTTVTRLTPTDVVGLQSGVVAVRAGGNDNTKIATCAVLSNGGVKCWGDNGDGQLGNGNETSSSVPVNVVGLNAYIKSIAVGNRHVCATTSEGGVKCWGWNSMGQLGDGTTISSSTPVNVIGIDRGANAVATGYRHSCVIMDTSEMKCWGSNGNGQLGNNTKVDSSTPVNVIF